MLYLVLWWVLLQLLGFAALPVTMRFLRVLPDRGYTLAKPLALLLWVYPFWILGTLGFLQNSFGALAFMAVAVGAVSWGVFRGRGSDSVVGWLRAHWRYVIVAEVVFATAYLAFAYFRAFNPEITATEKPMEFMFLNSILQSATFPPRDAWLSGFAISYYYLGYVIVAALAKLGNIPSGYAFNLGLVMTYAMTAMGAFGLTFNLVSVAQGRDEIPTTRRSGAPYVFGALAVFLVLIVGNLQGAVEVAYNANLGAREDYAALNLHGLEEIEPSGTGIPEDNWWWWRASRVVNDVSPTGGHAEIIDEFPAFSFLLGDLHPHVLSLPFCVLALAIALNLLLTPRTRISSAQGLVNALATPRMLLTELVVGALGMLNTWDIVTYGIVIVAAFAVAEYRSAGKVSAWVLYAAVAFLVVLFAGGYVLFVPFYLGFSSQAHGIAPNIFNRTPLHQYLIMWGLFVFVIAGFTGILFGQVREKAVVLRQWIEFGVSLLLVPLLVGLAGVVVLSVSPSLRELLSGALGVAQEDVVSSVLREFGSSFVTNPGTFLLLVILISGVGALGRYVLKPKAHGAGTVPAQDTAVLFALLLALIGLVLTFGVEFLYIRDSFESRMNTVFKLYYQSWLLLGIASAFGAYYIWQATATAGRAIWVVQYGVVIPSERTSFLQLVRGLWVAGFAILFILSMAYPVLAYPNRANSFKSGNGLPTLDGWRWVERTFPDDYAAIEWARANIRSEAVILEAAGAQYSFDNRVSVATGLSTVLGWGGHELQWRGNSKESDPRARDIEEIYKTRNTERARELLNQYNVSFVIVGDIERGKYSLSAPLVDKFGKLGEKVFEQGSMRIYRVGLASASFNAP